MQRRLAPVWRTRQPVAVNSPNDFDRAFSDITRAHVDALLLRAGVMLVAGRSRIVGSARRNKLPGIYALGEFVDAGGLMSCSPNVADNFRRAAGYMDKILKGAKPADLPVAQSNKFELVINKKTANALGITIPPLLLQRADRVIE